MHDIRRTAIWAWRGTRSGACGRRYAIVWCERPVCGVNVVARDTNPRQTRAVLEQRIATTNASIAAKTSAGETVLIDLYQSLAFDAYVLGDLVTARESYEYVVNANPLYYIGWNAYAKTL